MFVVDVVVGNQQAELPRQRKKVFPFRTICMGGASIIPLVLPPLLITVTLSCLVSGFLRVCANVYCNTTRTVGFDCSVLFPYCLHVRVEHTLVSTKPNMVSLDIDDDVASGFKSRLLALCAATTLPAQQRSPPRNGATSCEGASCFGCWHAFKRIVTNSEIATAANCSTRGVRRIRSNIRYYGAP